MNYRQLWIIKIILLLCLGLSLAAAGRTGYQVVTNARQSVLEVRVDKLKSNLEEISPVKINYQAAAKLPKVETGKEDNFFTPLDNESSEPSKNSKKNMISQLEENNNSPSTKETAEPETMPKQQAETSESSSKQPKQELAVAAISVYGAGERNMAILKDKKNSEIYLVKQGTTIKDYQVVAINKQSVTLKQGEKKISLTLPDGEDE